jgi:hypothetical protein
MHFLVVIGQNEMGLTNKSSPFKNANGRLGVGGHVFQFVILASGISYGDDIGKKENNVKSIKITRGNRSSTPPLKNLVMHQIPNQSMICRVLRIKLKLLNIRGTWAEIFQHLFMNHEVASYLLQHLGVE